MHMMKKLVALTSLLAMVFSSAPDINAVEYVSDVGGLGYAESRKSPSLTPAIALGAIALVAIIAVAVQNSSHGESCHGHNHCD